MNKEKLYRRFYAPVEPMTDSFAQIHSEEVEAKTRAEALHPCITYRADVYQEETESNYRAISDAIRSLQIDRDRTDHIRASRSPWASVVIMATGRIGSIAQ